MHDAKVEHAQVRQNLLDDTNDNNHDLGIVASQSDSLELSDEVSDLDLCTTDEERSISQLEKWSDNENLMDVTAFLGKGMFNPYIEPLY